MTKEGGQVGSKQIGHFRGGGAGDDAKKPMLRDDACKGSGGRRYEPKNVLGDR